MTHATTQRPKEKQAVVFTSKAKCRDCYRCVRVCPVNAIKMKDGQAQVVAELCIACGTCILNCPQHAKEYRSDSGKVLQMIEQGMHMAISVAPSYVVYYNEWEQKRLPSALRMAGFNHVAETAVGAWHTAIATKKHLEAHPKDKHICTACPAVVSYVMHAMPERASMMVPVASPMLAHARMIKKKMPDTKLVFVGPCVAKKDEAMWNSNENWVDAVITFEELDEIIRAKNVEISQCEESAFSETVPGEARLFPLEGGLLRTANLSTDMLDDKILAVSGYREVKEAINMLGEKNTDGIIIEPLFCKNGCINGPFSNKKKTSLQGRTDILQHVKKYTVHQLTEDELFSRMDASFPQQLSKNKLQFSEAQIRQVLQITGKNEVSDELNCTACGYPSCRDKAIAVLRGMAEPEMCIPFMRRKAEQQFDTMISHDPNGILLLDHHLNILHMNSAFKKMFSCSDALLGRKISYLFDPGIYERLQTGKETVIREANHFSSYNLICHVVAYTLPEEQHYVGVYVDTTDTQSSKEKLTAIKSETVIKAQELIDHQINMAHELARFLGENTAMGESLMKKLIDSIRK